MWRNWHAVDVRKISEFKVQGMEKPEPTLRKLMKAIRIRFPYYVFRVKPERSSKIKQIQYAQNKKWRP